MNTATKLVNQLRASGLSFRQAVDAVKLSYINEVLNDCRGNRSKAARALGMHRNTLGRMMDELGTN